MEKSIIHGPSSLGHTPAETILGLDGVVVDLAASKIFKDWTKKTREKDTSREHDLDEVESPLDQSFVKANLEPNLE